MKKIKESLLVKKRIKHFHFAVVFSLRPFTRQSFPSQPKQIDRNWVRAKKNYFGVDLGVISGAVDLIFFKHFGDKLMNLIQYWNYGEKSKNGDINEINKRVTKTRRKLKKKPTKTGPCEGRTHDLGVIITTLCRLS